MSRSLSLLRRRLNLVDLSLQARPGIGSYQFYKSINFDVAFTLFDTIPASGKASATVAQTGYADSNYRGQTRFLFNPTDYSIDDIKPFWVQIKQVSLAGVVGPAEAMHLVLPYSSQPNRTVALSGGAPTGTTIADSLELQLPMQCNNLRVQTDGATDLLIAFEPGGYEQRVPSLQNQFTDYNKVYDSFYQLFVRGNGGATTFSASMRAISSPAQ